MLVRFAIANISLEANSAEIPTLIDADRIACVSLWKVPEDFAGQGFHRSFRGKTLTTINCHEGVTFWLLKPWHEVAAEVLKARGQHDTAREITDEYLKQSAKTSPLAVV